MATRGLKGRATKKLVFTLLVICSSQLGGTLRSWGESQLEEYYCA